MDKKENLLNIEDSLFNSITEIINTAKQNIIRSVNINMVVAYWLIGKEIVLSIQKGSERAEYGQEILKNLSKRLNDKFGSGFSDANLKNFRQFYLVFRDRQKSYPVGSEFDLSKSYPLGDELIPTFHPNLSWSHYRALMRVQNDEARDFYEVESIKAGWNKRELERQIHSFYYQRMLKSKNPEKFITKVKNDKLQNIEDILTSPNVLEFLNIPDSTKLYESDLENAIINNLQKFLLEIGKGFSFVARQKRLKYEDEDFFVDLVFFNYILNCFVLIDLKIGKLTHKDVGQMDSYVRMYEDLYKVQGSNPTIGIILCSEKNEAVAKYSVLNEYKNIFANKYMLHLPTEEQLANEIRKERKLIEMKKNNLIEN